MLNRRFKYIFIAVLGCMLWACILLVCYSLKLSGLNSELMAEKDVLLSQLETVSNEKQSLQDELYLKEHPLGGVAEHGKLYVQGAHLFDQSNMPIQLKGFSSHGLMWYPEYTNYAAMKTLKDMGANVFRLAMYVEQNDSYTENPKMNRKQIYQSIENCLAADMYVIVDWHVLKDENPNKHVAEATAFFEDIANRYADRAGVLYEICNEPNGETSWDDVKHYADAIIPVIRKNAPDSVIIVGTPKYCTNIKAAMEDPLSYENILYSYHFYSDKADFSNAKRLIEKSQEEQFPVFVSEWGLTFDEIEKEEKEKLGDFLKVLEEANISWINWSLSNKDEVHSAIRKDVIRLSGWTEADFTDAGRFVLEWLR